jgi:hypothetical protein
MATQERQRDFWARALRTDRRVIYVVVFAALTAPFLMKGCAVPVEVQAPAQKLYDYIDALKPGDGVLISFDYGPSTIPENSPMAVAVAKHCFSKGVKIYATALDLTGPMIGSRILSQAGDAFGKKQYDDWVMLGFKPGGAQAIILGMGGDVSTVYPTDYTGKSLSDIPAMRSFRRLTDLKLCISLAASAVPESWMAFAGSRYGVPVAAGVTGVMVADYYAFIDTKQIVGLLGGMKGAAEYERLVADNIDKDKGFGTATRGMVGQSAAHIVIILFVLFGNVAMAMSARSQSGRKRGRRR